ncbi:MAG: hypothetical protein D3908_10030 [Candidatus Electrothrix sp. AUS4]|nr:hypothetical protein [Candidatus Electrothrix sp. AUS4]
MKQVITPYIFSTSALTISLLSLLFQGILWRKSNRPIVSAYLRNVIPEDIKNYNVIALGLVLINTGNMPATNIRISAKKSDIEKIFYEDIDDETRNIVTDCFEKKSEVALLLNGEKIETAFGISKRTGYRKWKGLKCGETWLPIRITYKDLNKRRYCSSLKLRLRDPYGFGGSGFDFEREIINKDKEVSM